METKTKTYNIYSFKELSDEAKENATQELWDINLYYGWWEFTLDDAERIGLKITEFDLDRRRYAKGEFILSAVEVAANILKNHGEQCETYKIASSFLDAYNPIFSEYLDEESERYESYEAEEEMMNLEDEFLKELIEEYSLILQREYEWRSSEEAIIETIEANEYEFTEDGKLF